MGILEKFNLLSIGDKIQTIFFILAFLFMVFSILGWVIELFFRRYISTKKWINPGLLKGPYLPIYGIGTIILTVYTFILLLFKEYFISDLVFNLTVVIGIGVLLTVVELLGGLIFIRAMKIKLWDYSDRILNFKGIICLEFSIIWTILGAVFYFILFEPIVSLVITFVTLDWFTLAVFFMGIFYGIFIVDLTQSLNLAHKIKKLAIENDLVIKWELLKVDIKEKLENIKAKSSFISPFKSPISLGEHFKTFIDKQKNKIRKK